MFPHHDPKVREALRRWLAEQGPPSPHLSVRRLQYQMRKRTLTFFSLIEKASALSYAQANRIHLLMPEKFPIVREHIDETPAGACRIVEPTEQEYMQLGLEERGRVLFHANIQPDTPANKRLLESLAACEPPSEGWAAHTRLTSFPQRKPQKEVPMKDSKGKLIVDAQYYFDHGVPVPKEVVKHWRKNSASWQHRYRRYTPPRGPGLFEPEDLAPKRPSTTAANTTEATS